MTRASSVMGCIGISVVIVGFASACLFAPQIEQYGYTACSSDDDCPAGRACDVDLCAPPPWFEDSYKERRLLVVENRSDLTLSAGTAVPVSFGARSLVDAYPGIETRFMDWNKGRIDGDDVTTGWSDVAVYRDFEPDRLTAFIPTSRAIAPQGSDVLAWIYTERDDEANLLVEDANDVFTFHDFSFVNEVGALDDTRYITFGSGAPLVENRKLTVGDNQQVTLRTPLSPPFSLTATMRIVGNLCDALFLGVVGNDTRPGNEPPYAGFFFGTNLLATADVAPTATSNPAPLSAPRATEQPGALHRYELVVGEGKVRFFIDGVLFDEGTDLRPPFSNEDDLFFTLDVDGNCAAELTGLWLTARPFDAPVIIVDEPIAWRAFQ
jgi:hypothetical protein